jgi:hypothetical protein
MLGGRTNAERAEDGGDALLAFAETQYHHASGEEIPTALGDLACSLLHYLASMGFDDPIEELRSAVDRGEDYFRGECFGGETPETGDGSFAEEPPFAEAPLYDPSEWMFHQRGGMA